MARKKPKIFHTYTCQITGKNFKLTGKTDNPEELLSVQAWYELNPDKDDRPEVVKKKIALDAEANAAFEELAALAADAESAEAPSDDKTSKKK